MSEFRRRLMMGMMGVGGTTEGIPSTEAVAGDICVYGISEGKLIIVNDWSASKYPINKYPPVGVVVVPGSHGHYDNGKCAIISLNYMNCETPQQGGGLQRMCYGDKLDLSSLKNYTKIPLVGYSEVSSSVIAEDYYGYLPSDHESFETLNNPYDTKTNYYYDNDNLSPSPYNNKGGFNKNYSLVTAPSSANNMLSDFNGINNTKAIISQRGNKDYSSWKPNAKNTSDYPAASCCDMYFTKGTNQGEWYLPSAGEFGYVIVRQKEIINSINKLIQGNTDNIQQLELDAYITSTECNSEECVIPDTSTGMCWGGTKNSITPVRAFRLV